MACNIHMAHAKHCPFCAHGWQGQAAVMIAIVAPQLFIALRDGSWNWPVRVFLGGARHISRGRRRCRPCPGPRRQVLEPVDLADRTPIPAYLNFLWDSNPQTYYSSLWSSGSPSKSSTAAEAVAAAVCASPPDSIPFLPLLWRTRPRVPRRQSCRRSPFLTVDRPPPPNPRPPPAPL